MLTAPVEPLIVISTFGPRPRPNGPLHLGIDLACKLGQDVRAVATGVVLKSYLSSCDPPTWRPGDPKPRVMGYGNVVFISHDDGTQARYAHLDARTVREGDRVDAGQVIGRAGTTGYSFGVHLHFELRRDGKPIDPLPFFAHLNPAVISRS